MDRVCPLLALAADRRTAVDGVDAGHRCHALDPPAALERDRQAGLCLTAAHVRCERFLAHVGRGAAPIPGAVSFADGLASTRFLITPEPAWRGIAGHARGSSRGLAAMLAVLAVGGTGAAIAAAGVLAPDDDVAAARPTSTATAAATPSSSPPASSSADPGPSAAASGSATPSSAATAAPTPIPATPAPTPAPTPQRTYVVQQGDTLALIAQQFGSSVASIQAVNGIADPDEIVIGQVLVIP